mgnify:CR=1 FL=1
MSTWKKVAITEDSLPQYLQECCWEEWMDLSKDQVIALIKEQMGQCNLEDEEIHTIFTDWSFSESEMVSEDDSWIRESAMLAGMAFGTRGYNEVMGYEIQEHFCYSCDDRGCHRCE